MTSLSSSPHHCSASTRHFCLATFLPLPQCLFLMFSTVFRLPTFPEFIFLSADDLTFLTVKMNSPTSILILSFSLILFRGNVFPLLGGNPSKTCHFGPCLFSGSFFYADSSLLLSQLALCHQQIKMLSVFQLKKKKSSFESTSLQDLPS